MRMLVWGMVLGVLAGVGVFAFLKYEPLPLLKTLLDRAEAEVQLSVDEREATRTVEKRVVSQTRVALDATAEAETARVQRTRTASATLEAESMVADLERQVHAGINSERVKNGGGALRWNDDLAGVARAHSDDMTSRGYFSHDTPEGLDPTDRLHGAGLSCRKGYRYGIAENIAIETSLDSVQQAAIEAVRGWMNSSGHRRNLLSGEYDKTGVGASFGTWRSYRAVYITQVFC